jgi:hypothetical protein
LHTLQQEMGTEEWAQSGGGEVVSAITVDKGAGGDTIVAHGGLQPRDPEPDATD